MINIRDLSWNDGLVSMFSTWCCRLDIKDKQDVERADLPCAREIDDSDCSRAQRLNNALAGCVVQ